MGVRKRVKAGAREQPAAKQPAARKAKHEKTEGGFVQRSLCYLFEPHDASYLAMFRIMWGCVMMLEMYDHVKNGFAKAYSSWYTNPSFMFKYWGMEWSEPLEFTQMKVLLIVMLVLALFVTVGFFYRTSCVLYAVGFVYLYSLEAGLYLNHFYLVIVMAFMLAFLPCNVYFSVDAYLWPSIYRSTVPRWVLWTIRAELWIVYTYAGVAKLNLDWLRAEPLRHWLPKRFHYPFIGWFLQYEPAAYFFSYGGLIYDLFVGTWLLVPQTFYLGLASTLFFHLTNKYIFNIGIFPWLMIATTTLFFRSSWPRYFLYLIKNANKRRPPPFEEVESRPFDCVPVRKLTAKEWLTIILALAFLGQQLVFPLRHYTYPDDPFWNEHGHRYSWRMKLRDKQCEATAFAYQPETQEWFEYPSDHALAPRQYQKLTSRPEFMIQFAHYAADRMLQHSPNLTQKPELYFYAACRVNYRGVQMLTDPRVNLVDREVWDWPYDWVTTLPELTEEEASLLPWNWEWSFAWLLKPWKSNIPALIRQQEEQMHQMMELEATFQPDFEAWVLREKFEGDLELMRNKKRNYVNLERKKESREKAMQGLLLPPYMYEYAKKLEAEGRA